MQDESRLIELIYAGVEDPASWQAFLDGFRARLSANHAILIVVYPEDTSYSLLLSSGMTAEQRGIFNQWLPDDPWAQRVDWRTVSTGEFRASQDICPDKILEATDIYREMLAPFGWHYGGGIALGASPLQQALLASSRPKALGPFAAEEIEFHHRLSPHLVRAVKLHDERTRQRAERDSARMLLDSSGIPLMLLGAKGQIRMANAPARLALASGVFVDSHRGFVRAVSTRVQVKLLDAIARLASPDTQETQCSLVLFNGEQVCWANLMKLALPGDRRLTVEAPAVALSLIDPARRPRLVAEPLCSLFGLTRAEAQVALQLAEGLSPEDAALRAGVTIGTMRTHIKRILSKTSCRRQGELVSLVLRIARPPLFNSGTDYVPEASAAD